jgi:hypothetical protein
VTVLYLDRELPDLNTRLSPTHVWLTDFTGRTLLEKLSGPQLVKKSPTLYGNPGFITAFKTVRQLHLSWARSIPSPKIHVNSIIPTTLMSLKPFFALVLPTRTLQAPLLSPTLEVSLAHLVLLNWTSRAIFGQGYRSYSSSSCSLLLLRSNFC